MTFEQFKADWRKKEATEGTKLTVTCICGQHQIQPAGPLSDEELLGMYQLMKGEQYTGVTHHGDVLGAGGDHGSVLTLTGVGH